METVEPLRLLRFGVFELDRRTGELRKSGRKVQIQEQPFRVLATLLEQSGEIVSREELRRKLWQADTFVDFDTGLNKAIAKVREALTDSADSPRFIETMPRRGYRFIAPVEAVPFVAECAPAPALSAAATGADTAPESTRLLSPGVSEAAREVASPKPLAKNLGATDLPGSRRRMELAGVALASVLLAGLAVWAWQSRQQTRSSFKSIAVLPLHDLSGDPSQEYFADGMTDELITDLAQIHSIRVISRTSAMRFKHTGKTLAEIASALRVDAIVEGSVLRSGSIVRVNAQLVDARQDRQLWAASYERQLADVVGLQHEVAREIAAQVRAELTQQEHANLAKLRPTNPEAYQAMLKGRFYWNERTPAGVEKAIGYFKQAVEIDPDNAEAWAGLGGCYTSLGGDQEAISPDKVLPGARAAVARALAIDSNLAEAHLQLAWIKLWYDWDWAGAEAEFRRAIELNPNGSSAHRQYSFYLKLMKRFDEALAENKRAIDLDPLDTLASIHLAWIYTASHQPEKALEQCQRVLEMDPGFNGAYLMMAQAYEEQRKWPQAIAAYEKTKNVYSVDYLLGVGHAWAASGHRSGAQASLVQLQALSKQTYVSPVAFAGIYLALGERKVALEWLERAYRERATRLAGFEIDSIFDDLRSDPRFQDLLRRVGLP